MEYIAIILFISLFIALLKGYPVSITLGGLTTLFALGLIVFAPNYLNIRVLHLLNLRVFGIMNNYVLMAVPLFIFMGIMLEKSGLAAELLHTMAILFGKLKGGMAISVVIVGAMLAASTGIVGATVVTMGMISLPTMLKNGYSKKLATGTIAASGTLGVIIPPSILLVLLADTIANSHRGEGQIDVGILFKAAIVPGLILIAGYIIYIIIASSLKPTLAPAIPEEIRNEFKTDRFLFKVLKSFVLPFLLILAVLGSIFLGIATPTEAAAVGAIGAILLTIFSGKFSFKTLKEVMDQTMHLSSMVFLILLGATVFAFIFRIMGGDDFLHHFIESQSLSGTQFLLFVMVILFVTGFFIDFIELIFIVVPVVTPIFNYYEMDMLWVGILIAMNLQTSFITPPFGFSLFYLKGVSPPEVKTMDIYKGIIPFLLIQLLVILLIILFPSMVYWI